MKSAHIVAVISVAAAPAFAQAPTQRLTAQSAQAIIAGCAAHAEAKGQSHAIAVYDAGANPVAFLRMEGNGAGVGAFSMEKAKAAAMWGFPTSGMAEAVKDVPGFADAPGVVTVGGGVPIFSADGKMFLGAAAASGEAPEDDASCVEAGIKAAGLSAQRAR
ncbi:MAG: heme-binding protein [Parvularculaceae bacterium]